MRCPECQSYQTVIIDSRQYDEQVRRRRECHDCGTRWNTIEVTLVEHKRLKQAAHEKCTTKSYRKGYR